VKRGRAGSKKRLSNGRTRTGGGRVGGVKPRFKKTGTVNQGGGGGVKKKGKGCKGNAFRF